MRRMRGGKRSAQDFLADQRAVTGASRIPLQQEHAEEQKLLQEKQRQERQNQSKPQKRDRPPEAKP